MKESIITTKMRNFKKFFDSDSPGNTPGLFRCHSFGAVLYYIIQ